MTNETRIRLERQVVRKYVSTLLKAGAEISVNDGEEWVLKRSTQITKIMGAMFSTDEDILRVWLDNTPCGNLYFVYGNEPGEVLNDYNVGLEQIIAPANIYAEQYA